jgi:hypothetical protein
LRSRKPSLPVRRITRLFLQALAPVSNMAPAGRPTPHQQLAYRNHLSDNTQTCGILELWEADRVAVIP